MTVIYFETWHLPGEINMALDMELGRKSLEWEEPVLRIYSWEKPTLSIGRHQNIDDINLDFLRFMDIACVRRPTGGRAVLHWEEITYSIVFPKGCDEFNYNVLKLYREISKFFEKAFKNLGLDVEMSQGKGSLKNPACFSSSARYELLLKGRKFIGSAQLRTSEFVLQHGSILLRLNEEICSKTFRNSSRIGNLKSHATGILEHKHVEVREIVEAIKSSFDKKFSLKFLPYHKIIKLLRSSEKLRRRYFCLNST